MQQFAQMRFGQTPHATRLLQVLMWAALVLPAALFAYAAWANYRALGKVADERIERTLDVLQEHALRVFQTIDRTIAETNEVLRGLTDEQIRADEPGLHRRLRQTQEAIPQIEAIWAFDRNGRPLVASTVLPVPQTLNNSDRDYFKAHVERDAGTYIGDVIKARIGNFTFFVVSRRRPTPDGRFDGVVAVTVPPTSLKEFYARIGRGTALSAGLIRADGTFLARYPAPSDGPLRLGPGNRFMEVIVHQPEAGTFTAVSQIDRVERRIGYRKLPGYPVYVQAGFETAAVWRELRSIMAGHLVFGIPATLMLVLISALALQRTRRLLAEAERREAAEERLRRAQRLEAIGQITGGVAHDFNNLLMVVVGSVDRLRRLGADPKQVRYLDAIDKAARRGESLTRQLLTFSRQQTVSPVVLDLGRRLPKLRDMLQSSLRGNIDVRIDVPPGLWPVKVDPGELELAILNLAVNARDAMPSGGTVTLTARNTTLAAGPAAEGLTGEFVAVSVRDTGAGIPADVLPKVFEPFFTTKEVGKGTGLGLSQVYGFAKQAGGTASIASEVGRGTEITLYLPRSHEQPAVAEDNASAEPGSRAEGTILLVEDNAEIAEVTKANLEELGYVVVHVTNAHAALEAMEGERRIDLVFSDVVMP
ncbi:MAG: ATP-binding protein, partial [Pseudomonadota bacterium]|nr:ATP-binding protein [Pseudomonadota bacterium]